MSSATPIRIAASFSTILFSAIQISLIALYPELAEQMGVSLSQVILSFSAGSLLFLWASPFWGKFSDQNGRKSALVIGVTGLLFSLIAIVFLFYNPATPFSLAILITSRILYGLTASAITPVAQAIQRDLESEARHRALSRHSLNLALGRVIGLLVFATFSTYSVQVLVGACILLATGGLAITNLKSWTSLPLSRREYRSSASLSKSAWLTPSISIVFLFAVIIECLNSIFSKTIRDRFTVDIEHATRDTALLLLASAIVILLTQVAFRRYSRRLDTLTMARHGLKFGSLSLGLGVCGFTLASQPIEFLGALTLISLGIGTIPPSYLALITHHDPSAQTAGRVSAVQTLGYFVGGIAASVTLSIHPNTPFAVLLGVAAFLVAQIWVFKPLRKVQPQ